jgi:lipopolysaccharide biosynthesis regulator YciM
VLRLDPDNEYALSNLEKLYAEQHQWDDAYRTRQRLAALDGPAAQPGHLAILGFLENELGTQALKRMDFTEATRRFEAAIELDATNTPRAAEPGRRAPATRRRRSGGGPWEKLVERSPDRAYLAFARLESAHPHLGDTQRFPDLCRRLIAGNPQDWRARLALARHLASQGQPREALDLLFDALVQNPHALSLHQAIWQMLSRLQLPAALVNQYVDLTRGAIFYADPHICVRCRYRSTELLWQCPNCHDWNTFVEERIAPAKDSEASLTS